MLKKDIKKSLGYIKFIRPDLNKEEIKEKLYEFYPTTTTVVDEVLEEEKEKESGNY